MRGVAHDAPATAYGVRLALADAAATMHLALDPKAAPDGDEGARRLLADYPPLFELAQRVHGKMFRAWRLDAPGDHPTLHVNHVRVGAHTLSCSVVAGGLSYTYVANVSELVAVIEDPSGGLRIVDRALNMVSLNPELFRGRRRLLKRLDRALAGVPRLSTPTAPLSREELRAWTRKARRGTSGRITALVLLVLLIAGWNIVPRMLEDAADPAHAMGETVDLAGGATMSVSDADARAGDGVVGYQVRVEFCGGPSANDVGPGDFLPRLADETVPRAAPVDGDLERTAVEAGQCVDGTLTYGTEGDSVQDFTVLYTDTEGAQITWSSAE